MRDSFVPTKIQADFHARIATPNNQNLVVFEIRARPIFTSMNNRSMEAFDPNNFRYDWLGIFAGGYNQPPGIVFHVQSLNPPIPTTGIELSALDILVELGFN